MFVIFDIHGEILVFSCQHAIYIDIMGVSETDLKHFDESKPFSLKGFKTFYPIKRQEMDMKRILCFVREGVEVIERKDLMSPNLSTIWLEYKPAQSGISLDHN